MTTRKQVLIVEDDLHLRNLIAAVLRDEQYDVLEAANGLEAVELLGDSERAEQICLILLDINLPGLDGLEVLRRLGTSGRPIPVVVMSAVSGNTRAALGQGARDALTKPFDLGDLLDVVARNCR